MNITGIIREFKLTSLALKNKTTIFILVLILIVGGLMSYNGMSTALFPDIVLPTVYVRTAHPGNSPLDIENLITRPLEKEINTIKGLNKLKSVSIQDHSSIFAEFQTDVDINQALLDVKDAVDRAKKDLPTDLERDPVVMEIDFSQIPIITINISGDYSLDDLKEYAEYLEEKIEDLPEINKAEIRGVLEKEMQIDADIHKMETHEISFNNIENAIRTENQNISGGDLLLDGIRGKCDEIYLNGSEDKRVPGNLNLSFAYIEGESLMMGIKNLAVSSGSACTSASLEPSYVLKALGVEEELAREAFRLASAKLPIKTHFIKKDL